MNYCFNYYRKSRNMENEAIGEFNIKYDKNDYFIKKSWLLYNKIKSNQQRYWFFFL